MNLKEFFAQKDNPPELYWSIVLEEGLVQAGVWYVKPDGVAEVIATSVSVPWETEVDLVSSTDAVLSSCVQKLPESTKEPSKTVFGVPASWSQNGEISPPYLEKIKTLCGQLSLVPAGFVVLPDAFAHLFKTEEGTPVNAVILGLGKTNLEISVFKLGNLVGNTLVTRSVSLLDDVTEGLSRFNEASPLPSRIIIFDGKEGETIEARDTLNNILWQDNDKIQFLHTPKIEVVTSDRKILAVSLAGASETGQATKIEAKKEPEPVTLHEVPEATSLGFVIGKDVNETVAPPVDQNQVTKTNLMNNFRMPVMPKVKLNFQFRKVSLFLSFLAFIIIGFALYWWFVPKAVVAIYVAPQKFEDEFEIGFSEAELKTVQVSGERSKSATGSRKVGEKAKGSVQIRNGTAANINLNPGTFLISAGDLRFTLENSASVSAALSPSSPGVATVNVVAESIGAEYNLAKDEVFKVANYLKAEVDATSTTSFSGGSSRDILAVSKEDQEKLLKDLEEELLDKAKVELSSSSLDDELVVEDFVETSIENEVFNHKIGDEADNLKLSMDLIASGVVTNKTRLADTVRQKLKDKAPDGFVLRDTQITYQFDFDREENGEFVFDVRVEANFLPEIKSEEIVKKISGKTPKVVEEYLTGIAGFVRAEIRIGPRLPGIFGSLPRVSENISIEVIAEK